VFIKSISLAQKQTLASISHFSHAQSQHSGLSTITLVGGDKPTTHFVVVVGTR
jgi:hypothetical protein